MRHVNLRIIKNTFINYGGKLKDINSLAKKKRAEARLFSLRYRLRPVETRCFGKLIRVQTRR